MLLTPSSERKSAWKNDDQLGNFVLTWDMETEMELVILTELDQRREEIGDPLIYVELSRARHHAIVIGELPQGGIHTIRLKRIDR